MRDYSVRAFRNGDEGEVVSLFNEAYGVYGGLVPRSVEYWRWCCLERPDVERKGVLLAFNGERLCGYLVAGTSGNIWEFCVTDDDAARVLLAEAISYLEKLGVSSVNINMPRDASAARILVEAGFGEIPAEQMFVTTLDPAALISALITSRREEFVGRFDDEFRVRLHDAPYGCISEFTVRLRAETAEVVDGSPFEHSVVVELRFMDLLSVLFEGSSTVRLFLSGKMRVKPFRKLRAVLRFLSAVHLRNSWFFPLSDFG